MSLVQLDFILTSRIELIVLVLAAGIARMLGFLFGFIAFEWGLGQMRLIRVSVAAALSLPLIAVNAPAIVQLGTQGTTLDLALILPKEVALGYGIGFLASLPFFALQYAGAVIDHFRGEAEMGVADPTGGQLHSTGQLHMVIAFFVFFAGGGLMLLVEVIYGSFLLWPLEAFLPALSAEAGSVAIDLIQATFQTVLLLMLPIVMGLFAIEMAVGFGTRLAQRYGIYNFSFLLRNLAYIAILPLWAMVVLTFAERTLDESFRTLAILERFFQ